MNTDETPKLNPWTAIWTKPRATIQQIVDTDPTHWVLPLGALAGISSTLDQASIKSLGDQFNLPEILGIAIIGGILVGILMLFISGALLRLTGKWLGGVATQQQIRAAIAWSSVPLVFSMLLWIPQYALVGNELFTTETPILNSNPTLLLATLGFMVLELVLAIWGLVIFLKCLGQVQKLSVWKALANAIITLALVLISIILVVAIFVETPSA